MATLLSIMDEEEILSKLICASMMCAEFDALKQEVEKLDGAGVDIFHIDIMDGRFVPNFGMGPQDIACIRKHTEKLLDAHLMIEDPGDYISMFVEMGIDILYIHPEADRHAAKTIQCIKMAGKAAGLAINPGTGIDAIEELLPLVDYVMVMTVNPGFVGQQYLEFVNRKILRLVGLKEDYGYKLIVDGAISQEKTQELYHVGVDGFVLGTSALFGKAESYDEIIRNLKRCP